MATNGPVDNIEKRKKNDITKLGRVSPFGARQQGWYKHAYKICMKTYLCEDLSKKVCCPGKTCRDKKRCIVNMDARRIKWGVIYCHIPVDQRKKSKSNFPTAAIGASKASRKSSPNTSRKWKSELMSQSYDVFSGGNKDDMQANDGLAWLWSSWRAAFANHRWRLAISIQILQWKKWQDA